MKRIAIIMCGSGSRDGSEIQESVTAMYAVMRHGMSYEVFAPNRDQFQVTNHFTGDTVPEKRNMLAESARVARMDKIHPLDKLNVMDFDGLLLPGGFGAAMNLFTFAIDGLNMSVSPDVERIIHAFHDARKPIGAMCIAPMMLASSLKNCDLKITLGPDSPMKDELRERMGVIAVESPADQPVSDERNRVVTVPCYMWDTATILNVGDGAYRMVGEMKRMMDN